MKVIALVLALVTVSTAVPTGAAWAQRGPTLEDLRDQGILYFKKRHFKPAKVKLDAAYRTRGGKTDFRTLYYRGQTAYKLLLLEQAFEMAEAAEKRAETKRQKSSVAELLGQMRSLYGAISLRAAKGETNKKGRIFFEAKTGIINRAKKKRFLSIRERFRSTDIGLPITIYMPYGDYLANKVPFSIVQGEPAPQIEIFLQVVMTEKDDGAMWWYVGIGGAVAVVAGVSAWLLLSDPGTEVRQNQEYVFKSLTGR